MAQRAASTGARRLGSVLEPVAGQVYFSPECHANCAALGFDPSIRTAQGVALPDRCAYFTSRGSVMGQVHGDVVAAAFAVFNPDVVLPSVALGWTRTDASTIGAAHDRLRAPGLVDDTALTEAGRETREAIEVRTDDQMSPTMSTLAGDLGELLSIMHPWGAAIRLGSGYLATGPHDLADAAQRR
jgi:hypothetical protein